MLGCGWHMQIKHINTHAVHSHMLEYVCALTHIHAHTQQLLSLFSLNAHSSLNFLLIEKHKCMSSELKDKGCQRCVS